MDRVAKVISGCVLAIILMFMATTTSAQQSDPTAAVASIVSTVTPSSGKIGDEVKITCRHLTAPPKIDFNGKAADIAPIKTNSLGEQVLSVTVPAGATSGPVHLTTKDAHVIDAGVFTIIVNRPSQPTAPDDQPVCGNPVGGVPPAWQGSGLVTPPSKPQYEADLDLPVTNPWGEKGDQNNPPTPIAPTPPLPPSPTIYGKNLVSSNGTIVYVIDVSGSMGWDMGQYTAPDGSTQTGDRLDRAKAQLIMSVTSIPASFKFNMYSYDCGCYPWHNSLQPADTAHKQDAISWISKLKPLGSTGTGPAMVQAMTNNSSCKLFALLTDGAPNCGAGDESGDPSCLAAHLQMIDAGNTGHAVIDTFGIGASGGFRQFCMDVASQNGGSYDDVR